MKDEAERIAEGPWRPHLRFGENPHDPNAVWAVTDGAGITEGAYLLDVARAVCNRRNSALQNQDSSK